jgi:hypothetical protein
MALAHDSRDEGVVPSPSPAVERTWLHCGDHAATQASTVPYSTCMAYGVHCWVFSQKARAMSSQAVGPRAPLQAK